MQLFKYPWRVFIKIIIFKRRETLKVTTTIYESYSIRFIANFMCNPSRFLCATFYSYIIYSSKKEKFTNRIFMLLTIMLSTRSESARSATATVLQVPGGGGGGPPAAPAGVAPVNKLGLTPAQVAPARYIS
jgi:hypothetical protein